LTVHILISGCIFRAPEQKTSQAGRRFVSATIKVGGESGNAEFWSLMVFSDSTQAELLRLGVGDALSAQGSAKIELYQKDDGEPRISRTVFANAILPLRTPPRERKKKEPAGAPLLDTPAEQTAGPAFFSDDIPFEAAL
jgi:hypothetical protein